MISGIISLGKKTASFNNFIFSLGLLLLTDVALAAELIVDADGGADFPTIQEAIDAAASGDTIIVNPGNYTEIVTVPADKDDLTIQGESGAVLSVASGGTGIDIRASHITVSGMTIDGPLEQAFTDVDWDHEGNSFGIKLGTGASATITKNQILDIRTGIYVLSSEDSDATSITDNLIDNTKGSILLYGDVADISNNEPGTTGNEWDIVILASIWNAAPAALTLLPNQDDPLIYGAAVMALSDSNGGMTVLDRRFADANRSHAYVAAGSMPGAEQDFGLGNGLGNARQPYGGIQHGLTAVVNGGIVMVGAGTYGEALDIGKDLTLLGAGAGPEPGATIVRPSALLNTGVAHKYTTSMAVTAFVHDAGSVTIDGMTIDGNHLAGDAVVFWSNASGTLSNVLIENPRSFDGIQTGQGLAVDGTQGTLTELSVSDSVFQHWNKNAIDVVNGQGLSENGGDITLSVTNSRFIGRGATDKNAQNAIVLWERAGGTINATIDGAVIETLDYTGADQASGILQYASANGELSVSNTTFEFVERPIVLAGGSPNDVDATTGNTFNGIAVEGASLTDLFVIESLLEHGTDDSGNGLIRVVDGQIYTTASKSIQAAIDSAVSGDVINVGAAEYIENITVATEDVTIDGMTGAILNGQITIKAAGAAVRGMEISSPDALAGIVVKGVGNVEIAGNDIHDIGTTRNGVSQGIYIEPARAEPFDFGGIAITGNTVSNVGNPAAATPGTNKGIHIGDASASGTISDITISGNDISDVNTSSTKGAYGISVNYGASADSDGTVEGLTVTDNSISGIAGGWVHAIGLEADTPDATVTDNIIEDLNAAGTDEAGIFFQDNPGSLSVVIRRNSFAKEIEYGVLRHPDQSTSVAATHNYWGHAQGPARGSKVGDGVEYSPWYRSTAFNANALSNYSPPAPPPPPDPGPKVPTPADVEDIVIPPADSGESVSDEVIEAVDQAATATTELADNIAENIDDVDPGSALDALGSIANVIDVTGNAAASTVGSGNASGATASGASGSKALNSFATVLAAIDSKINNDTAPAELTPEQKTAVQEGALKTAASAVKILAATPDEAGKKVVLENLGKIISSSVNLGVPLSSEQSTTLLDAAEQSTSADADLQTQLETSIPIKPRNKELISRAVLSEALEGSGISEEELNDFLTDLAQAINPADVTVAGVNAGESMNSVFSESVGEGGGSIAFNPATGIMEFIFGSGSDSDSGTGQIGSPLRSAVMASVPQLIPGRVISSNIVAPGFPEGIVMTENGSVVITRDRIASVLVPASYDPVNFYSDFRSLGLTRVNELGNVLITGEGFRFSGTFDYIGIVSGGEPGSSTTFTPPSGQDESELDYVYSVTYRDGSSQHLQPYVADEDFVASIKGHGLSVQIDRNTGLMHIDGLQLRPSYLLTDADADTLAFWELNKDELGIAYRPAHINSDGILDYEIISEQGVQVAYGISLED